AEAGALHNTRVVPDARVAAAVTLLDVAAECGRATLLNRGHYALLRGGQGKTGLRAIRIAVAAEHVRHGQRGTTHCRPLRSEVRRRRGRGLRRDRPWGQIEGARGGADLGLRDSQGTRRGRAAPLAGPELNSED